MAELTRIKGLGAHGIGLLKRIGIQSLQDLVDNVPRKYDDYSKIIEIRQLKPGPVTLMGHFSSIKSRYSKRGLHVTEALFTDATGSVRVMWFNQPYRSQSIKQKENYYLSGEFAQNYKYLAITNPVIELVSAFPIHTARLVPQYRVTKGLSVHMLRKYVRSAFELISPAETLPRWLVDARGLIGRKQALMSMHFPETDEALMQAKQRIGFEELFEMSLASALNKREYAQLSAVNIPFHETIVKEYVHSLPFTLTTDQRKSAWQILQDMARGYPMNRLLEGDVGSGKTVVAAIATVNVVSQGMQVAFMAPTEILARQHFETLKRTLPESLKTQVVLLSGGMKQKEKTAVQQKIKTGELSIIVGTHALIQDAVVFKNLALVIIDEQHRFGVEQRKKLQTKADKMPHVLHMSATPIPRSLMLTLYGELDISILAHKPKNRLPNKTAIITPETRENLYHSLKKELEKGRQVFVVCPLIEESEQTGVRPLSVESIEKQVQSWLKGYKVSVLHGKMKHETKELIMQQMIEKKIDVLVSTTVIEVGVDVPNASVMVIEGADRFGLAQLHQLRGRVGRGEDQGYCYIIPTANEQISKRLRVLESEYDGFKLAEYDLELRGPGAIYGNTQHGALDLRVAKITDVALIQEARQAATEFIDRSENLVKYPQLSTRVNRLRTITNLN